MYLNDTSLAINQTPDWFIAVPRFSVACSLFIRQTIGCKLGWVGCWCAEKVDLRSRSKLYAARNKRGQKRKETPDLKPWGLWQNGLRRILDTLGQVA
jgi:hypothetical protein